MKRSQFSGVLAGIGLTVMILDAKTAVQSANEGISLCLSTVIPSLFPFFVLSSIFNSELFGIRSRLIRPLCRLFRIPTGSEVLLLIGLLGGYPVGAKNIYDAYASGALTKKDAERMLGFCNNAGPAFIFGMLSSVFYSKQALWALWGIHIGSALLVAVLLPGQSEATCVLPKKQSFTLPSAVGQSVRTMAIVSAWVVLFRILIGFLRRWLLWLLPNEIQVLLSGLFELSNGSVALGTLDNEALRFLYASFFLSLGGLCVGMQTLSVIGNLKPHTYIQGKLLQTALSLLLSYPMQILLYGGKGQFIPRLLSSLLIIMVLLLSTKIVVAFLQKRKYNGEKAPSL